MEELTRLGHDDSDGFEIALRRRGEVFELVVNGMFAMDSTDASSEVALADLVDDHARRVLVGGLGLGFTAGALLDRLPRVRVDVAELASGLIRWADEGLVPSLTRVVTDPRATIVHTDVADLLRRVAAQVSAAEDGAAATYDAVLLDVDNGPDFLIHDHNAALYDHELLGAALACVAPGGLLAIWCEGETPSLAAALEVLAAREPGATTSLVTVPVDRDGHHIDYAIHCLHRAEA